MHEHQRADAAPGNQPGGDDRLAERRRRRQHAGLVCKHRLSGRLLLGSEFAMECHVERGTGVTLVPDDRRYTQISQNPADLVEAPSR